VKDTARNPLFIVFSLFLVAVMYRPLLALIAYAMDTEKNTHASQIVLIPFITAMLIYLNRKKIFQTVNYSVLPAMILMILGVGLLVAGTTIGANLMKGDYLALMTSAIVVLWLGGFLFFYGSAAFTTAIFPLLFLVFFIPIPSVILESTIDFLRRGSADMAFIMLRLAGMPVFRDGFFFQLPTLTIEIAKECSGIRSSISIVICSLLAGHLFLRSWWRRGILVIIAVPVLLFKNAIRISALSYLAVYDDPNWLTSRLHQEGGIWFFALGLLVLYPVLATLIRIDNSRRERPRLTG
jgi:exosortase